MDEIMNQILARQTFLVFLLLATGSIFAADSVDIYSKQEAKHLLAYDPCITLLKEGDPKVVTLNRKTLYFHGFGANKNVASDIKNYYGSERLPGDVVTFDFVDANNGGMDTSGSSLGQWNDIKTALYVLKKLHDIDETEVGITAHSRGGATAINMVAALVDQTDKYDDRLRELGIDNEVRNNLVSMLQKGHIVLECPLVELRATIQHHIEESTKSASRSVSGDACFNSLSSSSAYLGLDSILSLFSSSSAASVDYAAPLVVKEYRPWQEQAIKSADAWHGAQIPTIVHFQEEDEVLGTKMNDELYEKLEASNGSDYTHVHKGKDGGHNSSFRSFAAARNLFFKKYGASYKETA